MIDASKIEQTQAVAHEQLREGLDDISRAQLNLFAYIEKLGSHVVALEALALHLMKGQSVDQDAVAAVIAARAEAVGLPADCCEYATQVAANLVSASK